MGREREGIPSASIPGYLSKVWCEVKSLMSFCVFCVKAAEFLETEISQLVVWPGFQGLFLSGGLG
jgi:hypothetical protein